MHRLKREWKETIIPEEVLLRARNLAWVKIQRRRRGRRILGWAAAASTAVAIAALVWIWSGHETYVAQVSTPTSPKLTRPEIAVVETEKPPVETPQALNPQPVNRQATHIQTSTPAEKPERIVLDFTLPESGARMIWIMDSRFHFDGGVE